MEENNLKTIFLLRDLSIYYKEVILGLKAVCFRIMRFV